VSELEGLRAPQGAPEASGEQSTTAQAAEATDIRDAYRHCEQVTRTQARNFSYGIRLLPGGKRRALSAVYAFARRVDDIGDGTLPAAGKLAALEDARAAVAALEGASGADSGAAAAGDPVLIALADAARRYPIPLGSFGELIDGCEADVRGTSYATFTELEHYCRCVAGSIGRLSLGVFGSRDPGAEPLADALGIALQQTNILRDIREDLGHGRVYLPAEDLERYGCTLRPERADALAGDRKLEDLIRFEAQRALGWYATGMRLLPLLDRRSAACTGAMAGIYLRLLEQIAAAPAAALRQRQSLPGKAKAMVAARALAGIAPRVPAVDPAGPGLPAVGRPAPAPGGPVAGGPVAGGPVAGGPVAGGSAAGGPVAGGPVAGGPVAGGSAAGGSAAGGSAAEGSVAGGRP
jgi:phytoene synthase